MKKIVTLLSTLACVLMFNCSNDDSNSNSETLESTGVLGRWEVNARGINNITSGEAFCCETLELIDDTNPSDLRGRYSYDFGTLTNGTFSVDPENDVFTFTTENENTDTLFFSIDSNILEVWTFENSNRIWTSYTRGTDN
ncbi:hypothetical protein [uncultured Psychroserpens sp.]|uniref:hypothetical protein n=1 Tax=uncultured Psychroserpens sp. TaxID=255436 RepID=UPI002604D61A|nr:hypothetical protein [uncultured Psychroserpens sp.]